MSVWVPILLLLILAEVWWFGVHCTTYLSDIRDELQNLTDAREENNASKISTDHVARL